MREHAHPAGQGGAGDALEAVPVHADRSDPDRDVPEARRLRRAHDRAARHDRRARRLLRPRRDARFAEGAAARATSTGARRCGTSWRTSSRCRCRSNRVPRWLTEGISVWEERRARPEWGREMDITFAQALNEGKVLKLDVLNEGFQRSEDDLAGLLPGVAGRRAHRRHLRRAEAARAAARLRRGARGRDGDQGRPRRVAGAVADVDSTRGSTSSTPAFAAP